MSFILRIFFSGLIALVPSTDGKELTVLLLDTHADHMAGGAMLPPHNALLLARARNCMGDCPTRDAAVAQIMFADKPLSEATDSLAEALAGGGVWQLDGSELSLNGPSGPLVLQRDVRRVEDTGSSAIPFTAQEREDFSWVANLNQIHAAGGINTALLSAEPPHGVLAARLRLRSGRVFTYALIRVDGKVRPIHFEASGASSDTAYAQALASWVAADIEVPGDAVEIVDQNFGGDTQRSMKLTPRNGIVELALINLPPFVAPGPEEPRRTPEAGPHFGVYYQLARFPPADDVRQIPAVKPRMETEPEVDWQPLHPQEILHSDLLEKLRLEAGRGPYDRVLCPVGGFY